MTPLREISTFPSASRDALQQQFGINSAEAFYEHGVRNARGVQQGLNLAPERLAELLKLVEGYLAPDFVERCREPVVKRSRGVIVDE